MTSKTKHILLGLIPSVALILLGVLFMIGNAVTVIDWIISILGIAAGLAMLIIGIVRTKTIFNTTGLFGAFVLLLGILWLPKVVGKLSIALFIDLAVWIMLVLGALLFIDGFLALFIRRQKLGGVLEIVIGLAALVLGILIVAKVITSAVNIIIGILLIVIGILYLVDILTDGKIGIVVLVRN